MFSVVLYIPFLFILSQVTTLASDGEKENLSPNVRHHLEIKNDLMSQEKSKKPKDITKEALSILPENSLPLELSGELEKAHLDLIKGTRYNKIYLSKVFGPNNHPAFYGRHLNITPDVINPDVQVLSLRGCGLRSKNLAGVHLFQNLEKLCLSANPINNEAVSGLSQLKKLKILHMALTEINDEGLNMISQMPNLVELDISLCSKITDAGSKCLKNNMTLKKLIMESVKVSQETYQSLQHEGLEIIYFPSRGF